MHERRGNTKSLGDDGGASKDAGGVGGWKPASSKCFAAERAARNSSFLQIIRRSGADGAQPSGNSKGVFSFQVRAGLSSLWGFREVAKRSIKRWKSEHLKRLPATVFVLENQHLLSSLFKVRIFPGISWKVKQEYKLVQELLWCG